MECPRFLGYEPTGHSGCTHGRVAAPRNLRRRQVAGLRRPSDAPPTSLPWRHQLEPHDPADDQRDEEQAQRRFRLAEQDNPQDHRVGRADAGPRRVGGADRQRAHREQCEPAPSP